MLQTFSGGGNVTKIKPMFGELLHWQTLKVKDTWVPARTKVTSNTASNEFEISGEADPKGPSTLKLNM